MVRPGGSYTEPGGTWRPFWIVAAAIGVFLVLDVVLPGGDLPPLFWLVAIVAVLGVVGASTLSARRLWTVRVAGDLAVGRERVAFSDIDGAALRALESGADAGAPVLGGGWSRPKGLTGLPLRLTDGRTVLVPTRDPAALHAALVARVTDASDDGSASRGTLDP